MEKNSPLVHHLLRFLECPSNAQESLQFPPLVLYVIGDKPLRATDESKAWSMELPGLQRLVGHQITGDPLMYRIDLQQWTFRREEGTQSIDILCTAPKLLRMLKKPKSTTSVAKPIQDHKEVAAVLGKKASSEPSEIDNIKQQSSPALGSQAKLSNVHVEKGRTHSKNSKHWYESDWDGSIDVLFGVIPPKELLDIDRTSALLHTRARMSVFYSTSVENSAVDSRSRSRSKSRVNRGFSQDQDSQHYGASNSYSCERGMTEESQESEPHESNLMLEEKAPQIAHPLKKVTGVWMPAKNSAQEILPTKIEKSAAN